MHHGTALTFEAARLLLVRAAAATCGTLMIATLRAALPKNDPRRIYLTGRIKNSLSFISEWSRG